MAAATLDIAGALPTGEAASTSSAGKLRCKCFQILCRGPGELAAIYCPAALFDTTIVRITYYIRPLLIVLSPIDAG